MKTPGCVATVSLLLIAGCSSELLPTDVNENQTSLDRDPPLSDVRTVRDDAFARASVQRLPISAAGAPAKFTDLRELMSPIRNQAKRGVCSIFSTIGLMEHLYIKEGTIK